MGDIRKLLPLPGRRWQITSPQMHRNENYGPWARYFQNGCGRVTAVEMTEEWMVDLSELYLGHNFACGAHSRIYKAIYNEKDVAMKIIGQPVDDDNGKTGAQLEKQYTRQLAGACKQPPVVGVITEYLAGGSLRAFLHKLDHQTLPLKKLFAVALDIAHGMEYIHSQGVVHRDLKPENILLDEECCVKIAYFGAACEEAYYDALAEVLGTYRWLAPIYFWYSGFQGGEGWNRNITT